MLDRVTPINLWFNFPQGYVVNSIKIYKYDELVYDFEANVREVSLDDQLGSGLRIQYPNPGNLDFWVEFDEEGNPIREVPYG